MNLLLCLIFGLVSSFAGSLTYWLILALVWVLLVAIYRPSAAVLRQMAALGLIEVFMFFMILLHPGKPVFELGFVVVTEEGIRLFIKAILRWFFTTSLTLTVVNRLGMKGVLKDLRRIGTPDILIYTLVFMYQYMWILLRVLEETLTAVKLRGLKLSLFNPTGRKALVGVLVRLFLVARHEFRMSSLALESRGGPALIGAILE